MRSAMSLFMLFVVLVVTPSARGAEAQAIDEAVTQGALRITQKDGRVVECPLLHTDVKADIAGFIARVRVKQTFHNPTNEKIEAVYVFPLPHESAVDEMTMVIGERRIVGLIKRRAEARSIYEQALLAGQTAALLEQERPNIFTQSVGNIEPGQTIDIEIAYVDVLAYDMGSYEFRFPMVVGPRYVPGNSIGSAPQPNPELQGRVGPMTPPTDRVPDADRINPPVLKPGERTGHDISLAVNLEAGVPVQGLDSTNHIIDQQKHSDSRYTLAIHKSDTLPNKDFVLRYKVMGEKPGIAVLAHQPQGPAAFAPPPGYFMLMIQPKEDERLRQQPPREIVFLVDVSGSMSGEPTEKVKQAMKNMLQLCRADRDTMQLITFAGATQALFEKAVPVTAENTARALAFTDGFAGSGGTNMLEGVKAAIDAPLDPERVRIVIMLTDGYIGNESEIIEHVGKNCGDRVRFWCIGIGSSVNGMLVEGVAKQGGGMGKVLGLNDDAVPLTQEIITRIQRAQLAKVTIDWGTMDVSETYPARIPELWSGRPIVVFGRYSGGGAAALTVRGEIEGEPAAFTINAALPVHEAANGQLAQVWARKKIEDLMQQTYYAGSPAVEEMVTQIALEHRLMSQYTSFVAVDAKEVEAIRPDARPPRRMLVPVPLPAGTRYEGFFGNDAENAETSIVLAMRELDADFANGVVEKLEMAQVQQVVAELPQSRVMPALKGSGAGGGMARKSAFFGMAHNRSLAKDSMDQYQVSGAVLFSDGHARFDAPARPPVRRQAGLRRAAQAQQMAEQLAQATPAEGEATKDPLAETWERARVDLEAGRLDAAREAYQRVYFLDLADYYLQGDPWQEPRFADAALKAVSLVHDRQVEAWKKELPALSRRLDLVIRDQSVQSALASIGVPVALADGSMEDVAALLGVDEVRVSFLDLRNATVAEALDWICQPNRLSWWVEDGRIAIATERRRSGERAWVYDVKAIAWPQAEEIPAEAPQEQKPIEQEKPEEAAQHATPAPPVDPITAALQRFADAVRKHLGEKATVGWIGDGQLVIVADAPTHAKAAELLARLADPAATFDGELTELHKKTAARAEAGKDAVEKQKRAAELYAVAARMDVYTWPLLAAAANGQVDLEALTELQIAWKSPRVAELQAREGLLVTMRSAWAIGEAARALPHDAELAALAAAVETHRQRGIERVMEALDKAPDDLPLKLSLLYGSLNAATPADRPALTDLPAARVLLADAKAAGPLVEAVKAGVKGEDLVVLTALAARKAGGEAWETFRIHQQELLKSQPLPGSVIVLVNSLATPRLPVVAR